MRHPHFTTATLVSLTLFSLALRAQAPQRLAPTFQTEAVHNDADDPAIWVNPDDPEKSLLIGTNKVQAPEGALYVFDMQGKVVQIVPHLDRPNNVDIEYGFRLGEEQIDIAVTTERLQHRLRVFQITPHGLKDISSLEGLKVFAGKTGEASEPMGIALYKRPQDSAIFAIVAPKTGEKRHYLHQYRLDNDGFGRVKATKVREFGDFSGQGEIEAVAVDDPLGYVYYADEGLGIHKWAANPASPLANQELALFGTEGFQGDREGIGIYALKGKGKRGYLVCTDQIKGGSRYHLFPREGERNAPHRHPRLKVVEGGADETDGLEVLSTPLGARFPKGLVAAMNSGGKNFMIYRWEAFAPKR